MTETPSAGKYALARRAIMMAYTLLAPDERTTADLTQHLVSMQREQQEASATNTGSQETKLRLQRTLFFEALDALIKGLKGKWFCQD